MRRVGFHIGFALGVILQIVLRLFGWDDRKLERLANRFDGKS
jgi:hypothetical protein